MANRFENIDELARWRFVCRYATAVFAWALIAAAGVADRAAIVAEPAASQRDDPAEEADDALAAQTPQLLYLAWQKGGVKATGTPVPHTVWDVRGKLLGQEKADALLKGIRSFDVAWRRDGELNPLSLVFSVDRQLTHSPIVPTVITPDGKRHSGMTARNAPANGLVVSAAVPKRRSLARWPEQITVEISYPIENVTVIKTILEAPDDAVEVAPGIQWYLDPTRAREIDRDQRQMKRAPAKTAGVLQSAVDRKDQLTKYGVRIYLKGAVRPVSNSYATIIEPDGKRHSIYVSDAIDDKEQIVRIEVTRQRHKTHQFEKVPLRLDLLPRAE